MDNSGDFIKNDISQQQQQQPPSATSIVSSMTTATPITSEIISDFEPDPKFEITPLERASFEEIYNETKIYPNPASGQQIHVEASSTNQVDLFERIDTREIEKATMHADGKQQSSSATSMKTQTNTDKESDLSNLYSLSQVTVDAQMEKVIDNIVELGGVHQFPQTIGHAEDKEKLLASIHREITSERSSIDLIADVASQQQSIEISPSNLQAAQHRQELCPSSVQGQQQPDLIKMDNVSKVAEADEANKIEHADVTPSLPPMDKLKAETATTKDSPSHSELERQDTEENKADAQEAVVEESVIEEPVTEEPIIEEPVMEEAVIEEPTVEKPAIEQPTERPEREIPNQPHDESKNTGPLVEDLDQVVITLLGATDKGAKELHLEPVVEDAPSTDDDMQQEAESQVQPENSCEMEVRPDLSSDAKPPVDEVAQEPERMEVEEHKSPEPTRRRSGRKIKTVEKVEAAKSSLRPRRADKSEAKNVKEHRTAESQPVAETSEAEVLRVAPQLDLQSHEKLSEPAPAIPDNSPTEPSQVSAGERQVEDPAPEQVEEAQEPDVKTDVKPETKQETTRTRRELRDRLSKVLRSRDATKRGPDEEPAKTELPKIEPPKKQVKKTRGPAGESTTSYEAAKNTPLIKLPNYRSRQTISSSDPITRLDKRYESAAPASSQLDSDKKFVCHQCGFSTNRLNNLVYHSTKSFCKGKLEIGEIMKADIIRKQQEKKPSRKSMR